MRMHIALRDGFRGDTVLVGIDERVVFHRAGVTTDLTISHAASFDVDIDAPRVRLRVALGHGRATTLDIDPQATPFIDVSKADDGALDVRASVEQVPLL